MTDESKVAADLRRTLASNGAWTWATATVNPDDRSLIVDDAIVTIAMVEQPVAAQDQ